VDEEYLLRFRFWLKGQLADEVWIDVRDTTAEEQTDQARVTHMALAEQADQAGHPWLVETYDPASGKYSRFGTDRTGMVEPVAMVDRNQSPKPWPPHYRDRS